jgi:hypothetical protein
MTGGAQEAQRRPPVLAEARAETRPAVERLTQKQAWRARATESRMLEARPGLQGDFLRCR